MDEDATIEQETAVKDDGITNEAQVVTAIVEPVNDNTADLGAQEAIHVELITEGGVATEETALPNDTQITAIVSPSSETQTPMSSQSKKSGKQTADSATQEDSNVTITTAGIREDQETQPNEAGVSDNIE